MNRQKARDYIKRIMVRHLESRDDAGLLEHEIFGAWIGDIHMTNPKTTESLRDAVAKTDFEAIASQTADDWFKNRYKDDPNAFDLILFDFCQDVINPDEINDELCDDFIETVQKFFAGTVMFGDEGTGKEDRMFLYEPPEERKVKKNGPDPT